MTCCICGGKIDKHYTPQGVMYWDKGNNPEPVKTGEGDRCCDKCNTNVVLPARIKAVVDEPQEGEVLNHKTQAALDAWRESERRALEMYDGFENLEGQEDETLNTGRDPKAQP